MLSMKYWFRNEVNEVFYTFSIGTYIYIQGHIYTHIYMYIYIYLTQLHNIFAFGLFIIHTTNIQDLSYIDTRYLAALF